MSEVPGWRYYKRTPGPVVYCKCSQYYDVPYDPGSFFQTEYTSTGPADPWAFLANGLWMPFNLVESWCEWEFIDFSPTHLEHTDIIVSGDDPWDPMDPDGWTSWHAQIATLVNFEFWGFNATQRPRYPGGLFPRSHAPAFNRSHWEASPGTPSNAEPPFNVVTYRPYQCKPGLQWPVA